MSNSTKSTWLANAKRMALEADALEKKAGLSVRAEELKHEIMDMGRSRNEAKLETVKRVHGIRVVLTDIQSKIKANSWQSSNALKHQLESFESKLSAFKLVMRSQYDSLDETATALEGDIAKITDDMDSWESDMYDVELASTAADPHAQKRISERNKQDLERRAFIGAIDRKVLICLHRWYVELWSFPFLSDCWAWEGRWLGSPRPRYFRTGMANSVRNRGVLRRTARSSC
jgi:hypothetical protein